VGLSTKGTEIYTKMFPDYYVDPVPYLHGTVNASTGAISKPTTFWRDSYGGGISGIGDLYIARTESDSGSTGKPVINVYSNNNNPKLVVHCDVFMLPACGDSTEHMLFDPTGKYLLFTDENAEHVVVTYVDATDNTLIESGAIIPGFPYGITFSPSGLMLYTLELGNVHSYVFNPHSGLFTAKSAFNDYSVSALIPAK
jgi:hypothetical protein